MALFAFVPRFNKFSLFVSILVIFVGIVVKNQGLKINFNTKLQLGKMLLKKRFALENIVNFLQMLLLVNTARFINIT